MVPQYLEPLRFGSSQVRLHPLFGDAKLAPDPTEIVIGHRIVAISTPGYMVFHILEPVDNFGPAGIGASRLARRNVPEDRQRLV